MWITRREIMDANPPAYRAEKTWETPSEVYGYLERQHPAKCGESGRIEVVTPGGETMTRREFFERRADGEFQS